jgi:hypothetical protein
MTRPTTLRSRSGRVPTPEQIVRVGYARLARLQRADLARYLQSGGAAPGPRDLLVFKLSDFKAGPIADILGIPVGALVTKPSGDILQITGARAVSQNAPPLASQHPQWRTGQKRFAEDWERTTFRQLLDAYPEQRAVIASYVSYVVNVRYQERERTYRALAFFGAPDAAGIPSQPSYYDLIVGMGDSLGSSYLAGLRPGPFLEAMRRKGLPVTKPERSRVAAMTWCDETMCCDEETGLCCDLGNECGWDACEPEECEEGGGEGCSDFSTAYPERVRDGSDTQNHVYGSHSAFSNLNGICWQTPQCQRGCYVSLNRIDTHDDGIPSGACHQFGSNQAYADSSGGSFPQDCAATVGAAVQECFFCLCNVSLSVGIGSVEAPDAFWTYAHTLNHHCQP